MFEINDEKNLSKDRPRSFQIEVSKILVTNTRTNGTVSSRASLAKIVNVCQMKSLFLSDTFPTKSTDFAVITDKFIDHVQSKLFYVFITSRKLGIEFCTQYCCLFIGKDNVRNFPSKLLNAVNSEEEIAKTLFQELLWIDARDVW